MGRTAKYKKIKACDPFSKQNGGKLNMETVGIWGYSDNGAKPKKRSRTAEKLQQQKINRRLKRLKDSNKSRPKIWSQDNGGLNRPPSDNEDEFDLEDIQGSLKKQRNDTSIHLDDTKAIIHTVKSTASSKEKKPQDTIDKREIKEASQLLKTDAIDGEKASKFVGRRENESKKAYNRRVMAETRQIIKQTKMKELNPEKRKRKKEFLNQKKKRKRTSKNDNDEGEDDRVNSRAVDEVPFGHQVERPPIFKTLPRGASSNKRKDGSKKTMKTDKDVQAEQANLEKMRQKVQEQYALIKAKRKRAGDFHL